MSAPKTTIEIDGRTYDASTGKLIKGEPLPGPATPERVISDVVGNKDIVSQTIRPVRPKPEKPLRTVASRGNVNRKPQRSSTLMRPAVAKPTHKTKPTKKQLVPHVPQVMKIRKDRLERAKAVPKSTHIRKFGAPARPQTVVPRSEELEVREQTVRQTPPETRNDWPVIDQFEKAVQEASSHLETFAENTIGKKSRKLSYVFAALAVLLIVGAGAYAAIPMAKVKLAGNKAGFSASLPSSPSGFGMSDPVVADYGKVTLSYKSRTDDKGFKLVQTPSQWNSQSLISNFLSSHQDYQTVRGGGRTIYTYDDTDATWLDGGIWYKVEGNAKLSDDQLLKIAESL